MSNTQVGNVYQQIITEVIDTSRVDFEEGGVDEHVLEELRQGWQKKLSQLGVATFPWEPKPEPVTHANPPTVPSNAGSYSGMSAPATQSQGGLAMPQNGNNNNQPRIKTEPGLESAPLGNGNAPNYHPLPPISSGISTAQSRAAANLQQAYGNRAAASIHAMQNGGQQQMGVNGQSGMPTMQNMQQARTVQSQNQVAAGQGLTMPQQHPQQAQQPVPITQQEYQRQLAYNQRMQQQQASGQNGQNGQMGRNGQNGVGGAQHDGAGDEVESLSVIKRFNAAGEEVILGRVEIDGLIRDKIEAMGTAMEGGGLMLPLHQSSTSAKRSRKVKRSASGMAQADGGDDYEEDVKEELVDEDAINSDLDDPDEGLNDEEDEDEGMGHIMLCMYDKVQRVKNKWKCVMKDGVLTVNGKEYVFHKATGEYEW